MNRRRSPENPGQSGPTCITVDMLSLMLRWGNSKEMGMRTTRVTLDRSRLGPVTSVLGHEDVDGSDASCTVADIVRL